MTKKKKYDEGKVDAIAEILANNLDYVYCDTCGCYNHAYTGETDYCESCHRKNMYWCISDESAKKLAKKILDKLGE